MMQKWQNNWACNTQKVDKLQYVNDQIKLRAKNEALLVLGQCCDNKSISMDRMIEIIKMASNSIQNEIGLVSSCQPIQNFGLVVKYPDVMQSLEQAVRESADKYYWSKEKSTQLLQDIKSIFFSPYIHKLMDNRKKEEQALIGKPLSESTKDMYDKLSDTNTKLLSCLQSASNYITSLKEIKKDGMNLKNVKIDSITPELYKELCEIAVQQNGMALQFVPIQCRKVDLCVIAVRQNSDAGQHVPTNIQSTKKFNRSVYLGR